MTVLKDMMDQQVEDLRERMRLLQQDRRANVEQLESSKDSNAEEIKSLREENKKLRVTFTQLKKRIGLETNDPHELESLQRQILSLKTEFDSLKVMSKKNKEQANKLQDEVKVCKLEAKTLNQEGGPIARKIRGLENSLDKAMIKYNEAQSIKDTYEHIVKRLKDERVSFNNQLTALERTLQAKKRDYDELVLLSSDANHSREVTQHKLQEVRSSYDEKRSRREGEIRERKQVVRIRRQMLQRRERRETEKRRSQMKSQGKSNGNDEGANPEMMLVDDKNFIQEQETKLNLYEEAFRKIKDATGVSDVNDVIQKIANQQRTTDNLIHQTKQNQTRIEQLWEEQNDLKKIVDGMKFSGESTIVTRKMVDEAEERLTSRKCFLDRCKNKFDRISHLLISAKSGVRHLQNKVEVVSKELGIETAEYEENNPSASLWATGNVLIEVMARVREREMDELHHNFKPDDGSDYESTSKNLTSTFGESTRPFNQRVELPSAKDHDYYDNSSDDDHGIGDVDEEDLSRDRVKRASSQIMKAQERKKAREKAKK